MIDRALLEHRQVAIYLAAILAGLWLGSAWPAAGATLETLLWPVLALLLYVTFVQVPLLHLREAFGDGRFVLAVLLGNFVGVPLALALPAGWEAAAMVIVLQSLVELLGMLGYLAWLPRLFPDGGR